MKIDAKFYSENSKLYFIDSKKEFDALGAENISASEFIKMELVGGKSVPFAVKVKWSEVGLDGDSYMEEFLASLRDSLKSLEEKNMYAFIVPECDSKIESDSDREKFTLSMKHCARRIKDCENVIGFAVPDEAQSSFFMEELSAKHKQYVFFSKNENLLKDKAIVKF